jgi:selT/selW/selH-like putative selenoprotein
VRGKGGEFEVTLDGRLLFSKKAEGRFPSHDEVLALLPSA